MSEGYRYTDNIDFIKLNIDPYDPTVLIKALATWVPIDRHERVLEGILFARNIGYISILEDTNPNTYIFLCGPRFGFDANMALINELDQTDSLYQIE